MMRSPRAVFKSSHAMHPQGHLEIKLNCGNCFSCNFYLALALPSNLTFYSKVISQDNCYCLSLSNDLRFLNCCSILGITHAPVKPLLTQ